MTMQANNPDAGTGPIDRVEAIAAFLTDEHVDNREADAGETDESTGADTEVEETEVEAQQADNATDADETDPEVEDRDEAEDAADAEAVAEETDPDAEVAFRDADGKVQKVKVSALIAERMMRADYTRKTTELAALRKETEARLSEIQNFEAERSRVRELLPHVEAMVQDKWSSVDWDALATHDPIGYVQRQREYARDQEVAARTRAERERLEVVQINEGRKRLVADLIADNPELADNAKGAAYIADVMAQAKKIGLTEEFVKRQTDKVFFQTLHKAEQYDKLKGNAPKPDAKPKGLSATATKALPTKSAAPVRRTSEITREIQRARQTRDPDDRAAVISRLL